MTGDVDRVAYLDHAATTPMRPEAIEVLVDVIGRTGNPSSLHEAGRAARRVVEESRELMAERLGARPSELVMTAGGTEADNLAVKGLFWSRVRVSSGRRRVLVSAVEHHAVLDPARWLVEHEGAELVLLPVGADGVVDLDALRAELEAHRDETALVSVMWANNEIGTVQPVREVVDAARNAGVPVHVDAVQAVGQLDVDLGSLGADAVTVSAHKLGGPVGVGALVVGRGVDLTPVLHGGGQERNVRSGTVDVASIAAFARALDLAVREQPDAAVRLAALRDELVSRVAAAVPVAVLRGPGLPADSRPIGVRLPANAHFTFPGCEGDSLLYLLDSRGIQCSTGSACRAGVPQPSHVLLAAGVSPEAARGALRFSLGRTSVPEDVDHLVSVLPEVVERATAAGLASV